MTRVIVFTDDAGHTYNMTEALSTREFLAGKGSPCSFCGSSMVEETDVTFTIDPSEYNPEDREAPVICSYCVALFSSQHKKLIARSKRVAKKAT